MLTRSGDTDGIGGGSSTHSSPYLADFTNNNEEDSTFKEASQTIFGLYLPSYDEAGVETSVVRSKYTALFDNKIYRIKDPVIEFKNLSIGNDDDSATETIVVTSSEGTMDIESNVGTLEGDVIIQLDDDTQIKTDSVTYLPDKKSVYTDDNVIITGRKMVIRGRELEVNLSNTRGSITKNVEMELTDVDDARLFDIGDRKGDTSNALPDETSMPNGNERNARSYIKGRGKLTFDMNTNTVTFYDDVVADVGNMNILADKLRVILKPGKKKIRKIIADGDVLALNTTNIAAGDTLVWDAETGIASIEADKDAELLSETIMISSSKIRLYQNNNWIEAPSAGRIVTRLNMNLIARNDNSASDNDKLWNEHTANMDIAEQLPGRKGRNPQYQAMRNRFYAHSDRRDNSINVTWGGRMLLKNDKHSATFYGNVKVTQRGSQMRSEKLTITFNEGAEIESVKASGSVNVNEEGEEYNVKIDADTLDWLSNNRPMKLTGDPWSRITIGNKQLLSSTIFIAENGNIITADDKGSLLIKPEHIPHDYGEESNEIYLDWQGSMVFDNEKRKASFYDRIEAVRDGLNIRCDVFNVFLDNKEYVKKIVAMENVYVFSNALQNLEGLGTMLTWDVEENIAILTGDPVAELRKDGSRTLAKKVFFDINTRQVTWEGRTRWQMSGGGLRIED